VHGGGKSHSRSNQLHGEVRARLICLPDVAERIDQLGLSMMVGDNQAPLGTAFTTAITSRRASGSGISAQDRAITILSAVREDASGAEFITPGYVYPLRARDGGVLVRTGRLRWVDLRGSRSEAGGVICEILKKTEPWRGATTWSSSRACMGQIITVADIIEYRLRNENDGPADRGSEAADRVREFSALVYRNLIDYTEHLVLVMVKVDPASQSWLRAHRDICPATCSVTARAIPAACCALRWSGLRRRARCAAVSEARIGTRLPPSSTADPQKVARRPAQHARG